MPTLTIPPERTEDVELVKEFLFATLGKAQWTEEEYLAYSDRYPRLVELSEGRLVVLEMPTPRHQRIVQNTFKVFDAWAERHEGEAFVAPLPVRLWPGKFREPDVMLFSESRRGSIEEDYAGPPDLVVEVQSPGTVRLDTRDKLLEYAQAGVREYWQIDSERRRIDQNILEGDRFHLHAVVSADETIQSVIFPDLVIAVVSLFAS